MQMYRLRLNRLIAVSRLGLHPFGHSWKAMLPAMLLHIAVRLLCRDNYLTAKTDRFLMVSKESIMTPQGGLGGIWTGAAGVPRIRAGYGGTQSGVPRVHA